MCAKLAKGLGKKLDNKERARLRRRAMSSAAQDIGAIPKPEDPERRAAALADFKAFLLTYFPQRFYLEFSEDHDELCKNIQASIEEGESMTVAMPRSSGKTTILEQGALWGYLRGLSKFVVIVAATASKASDILESLKTELLRNDLLAADFPEVCIPIRHVDDEPRRCRGQTYRGQRTGIQWQAKQIRFAALEGITNGGIIYADGMSSALRGLRRPLLDGTLIRPDTVLLDDPQTDKSARSVTQTQSRWDLIFGAIKGLEGAGERLRIFAAVTVIEVDDLACWLLDPKRTSWRTLKAKSLYAFPRFLERWREYHRIMREDKLLGGSGSRLNEFYVKHRTELEDGAKVAWPARIQPGKITALQGLMEYWLENPRGFMAEHQQEPLPEATEREHAIVDGAKLARKTSGQKKGVVPPGVVRNVMYIDTHDNALFWAIIGADTNMSAHVIDYSVWPEQSFLDFRLENIPRKLKDVYPEITNSDALIYRGACDLVEYGMNLRLTRYDGREVALDAILADTGYKPGIWHQVKTLHPQVTLTRGVGIRASQKQMAEWEVKPEREVGHHWVRQHIRGREHPVIMIDTNYWKTIASQAMASPPGAMGTLMLYGDNYTLHDLFAAHCTAEVYQVKTKDSVRVNEWKPKASDPDNHWFDCVVGAFVAFNILGLHPPGFSTAPPPQEEIDMSAQARTRYAG